VPAVGVLDAVFHVSAVGVAPSANCAVPVNYGLDIGAFSATLEFSVVTKLSTYDLIPVLAVTIAAFAAVTFATISEFRVLT
jgi:lipopolysaccharide biosynthesis protein